RYPRRPLAAVRYLVIHHTGAGPAVGAADVAAEHVEVNGWPGIGYHYVIDRSGAVAKTQDLVVEAYHARQFNRAAVGIALAGDFASDVPAPAQLDAAATLLANLLRDLGLPTEALRGHRELVPTHCPGETFSALWKPRLLRLVEARLASPPVPPQGAPRASPPAAVRGSGRRVQ
ncbi:MAG: N-acetylmuramoyl-L-alanine amidase, partial [Anaerolineae bacterium]